MLEIFKKSQIFFAFFLFITSGVVGLASTCEECDRFLNGIDKEAKLRENYVQLKLKNEAYLNKPNVSPSAAIKVRSNIMLLGIKIETQDNKIEAIKIEMKKQGDCSQCPVVENKKNS